MVFFSCWTSLKRKKSSNCGLCLLKRKIHFLFPQSSNWKEEEAWLFFLLSWRNYYANNSPHTHLSMGPHLLFPTTDLFFSLKRFENEILRRTYKNVVLILKLDNVDFKDYQDTQRNMIMKNYSIFEDLQNLLGQKLIFRPKSDFEAAISCLIKKLAEPGCS